MNANGKWTLQHENDTQIEVDPKDARGLRLARSSGYRWVNKNDGTNWRQIGFVIRDAEIAETGAA